MSNDTKNGSDLDIFEGLGKKSAERSPGAPPPPPASTSNVPPPPGARPAPLDAKKTLLGIPGPAAAPPPATSPFPPTPSARPSAPMPSASAAPPPPASKPPPLPTPSSPPSASMRAASASKPPPPPGRGSLPSIPTKATEGTPSASSKLPPPPTTRSSASMPAARPSNAPAQASAAPPPATVKAKNGAKLEMDWDDDQEATHVFDKEAEKAEKEKRPDASAEALASPATTKEPDRASMDTIMSSPPPPPKAPSNPPSGQSSATLSGAFGALGQPREKTNGASPSGKFRSVPPASQSMRSAPPPPPPGAASSRAPATHPFPPPPPQGQAPQGQVPPPPPGQVTTAPMHMPPQPPTGSIPPAANTMPSAPPHPSVSPHPSGAPHPSVSAHPAAPMHPSGAPSMPPIPSAPPVPQMPPMSRSMEATAVVPREGNKTGLMVGLFAAIIAVVGAAVFFMMPRAGTLVVNVADSKGAAVQSLEILVDGTKRCESAPCIVREVPAGVHEVKIAAKGYETAAPRAVTIDKKDVTMDFQLVPTKVSAGTGFKVSSTRTGIKLQVDGKDIGPLPQEMRDLEPGEHKLRFVGDRYAPLEKTVSVAKDEIVDLGNIELKVLKGKATIQLGTPGAKVYLVNGTNRKEVPQFPMAIEFDPNEKWELQATKDGFEEYKERISFDDGQAEKTFNVTLNPKGSAAAAAPATMAATPVAPAQPAAPTPKAAAPTTKAAAPTTKEPDAPKEPKPAAATGEAFLKINSLPASSIVLDGKPIGPTPQPQVKVAPGSHTVMFVNSELSLKKTITVDVKAGETKAAFAKLRE